ncbi:hypothetical protein [Rhizobium sp. AG207R]|uniref:hypothetical protein n=1 Tax=Rhizobium sp. AG207R TaxID=2802287 RepID=UPI0022ABDBC1|nr:hypothetical protein [Rhizobium sp. AG207R]MCZ3380677.1 hypothetical protein [Rhizobium sp. AG207R]
MLIGGSGLMPGIGGNAVFDWVFLVGYLTIEDEKKEKRGRRSFAGPEEISVLERDFDGYVLNKRIHFVFLASIPFAILADDGMRSWPYGAL